MAPTDPTDEQVQDTGDRPDETAPGTSTEYAAADERPEEIEPAAKGTSSSSVETAATSEAGDQAEPAAKAAAERSSTEEHASSAEDAARARWEASTWSEQTTSGGGSGGTRKAAVLGGVALLVIFVVVRRRRRARARRSTLAKLTDQVELPDLSGLRELPGKLPDLAAKGKAAAQQRLAS